MIHYLESGLRSSVTPDALRLPEGFGDCEAYCSTLWSRTILALLMARKNLQWLRCCILYDWRFSVYALALEVYRPYGMDQLTRQTLRKVFLKISQMLVNMVNYALRHGLFPNPWKHSKLGALIENGDKVVLASAEASGFRKNLGEGDLPTFRGNPVPIVLLTVRFHHWGTWLMRRPLCVRSSIFFCGGISRAW